MWNEIDQHAFLIPQLLDLIRYLPDDLEELDQATYTSELVALSGKKCIDLPDDNAIQLVFFR